MSSCSKSNPQLNCPVEQQGITNCGKVHYHLTTPQLYEQALLRQEGTVAHLGPLAVYTGAFTGRAPKDRFIVREPDSEGKIGWGDINKPIDSDTFDRLYHRLLAFLQGKDIFVQDCYVGANPAYRLPIRIVTEKAWQNLFARNMFRRIRDQKILAQFAPEYTVIAAPSFLADPKTDGTRSSAFVLLNFKRKLIIIGGTGYGGEIKKSIFTVMNFLLPQKGVLPMHCSANLGKNGDSAVFFGLSGTGKTTLSADPDRILIGDDEHGWGDDGIFNFEGGCYAKVIHLSPEAEPQIYRCTRLFGTILENVPMDPATRLLDLDDTSITENTRAAYPLEYIDNASPTGLAPHPKDIVMLTCDAFGVLPPVSRLTPEQAMYHFLSGYTAKVAGTEAGIVEPQSTFSTCFGAPFMVMHPTVYSTLLGERIRKHKSACWLINTGWTGGGPDEASRIAIKYTRRLLHAALGGELDRVEFETEPYFGLSIPKHCPEIPDEVLNPITSWKDKEKYKRQATDLRQRFKENFKVFEANVDPDLREIM